MMGNWFSLCLHNVHRLLATAGKSIGTWWKEGESKGAAGGDSA